MSASRSSSLRTDPWAARRGSDQGNPLLELDRFLHAHIVTPTTDSP
jgi:hypothetical protein